MDNHELKHSKRRQSVSKIQSAQHTSSTTTCSVWLERRPEQEMVRGQRSSQREPAAGAAAKIWPRGHREATAESQGAGSSWSQSHRNSPIGVAWESHTLCALVLPQPFPSISRYTTSVLGSSCALVSSNSSSPCTEWKCASPSYPHGVIQNTSAPSAPRQPAVYHVIRCTS